MDSNRFQQALWDPVPLGNSLNELVEDWHGWLSEAINEIAPFHPGRGTEAMPVALTDSLWRHPDQGKLVLLLPDLTTGFDMGDHDLLIHCLPDVGIQGSTYNGSPSSTIVGDRGGRSGEN